MKYAIYSILVCMICACFLGSMASSEAFRKTSIWTSVSFSRHSLLAEVHLRAKAERTPDLAPISEHAPISSKYGMRKHPIYKRWQMHWGIDYPVPIGTPVLAVASGRVSKVVGRYRRKGYGRYIRIAHDETYSSLYAHLFKVLVEKGEEVEKGDTIGFSGNSGLSTNPHLHFELRKNGRSIDPIQYWDTCAVGP